LSSISTGVRGKPALDHDGFQQLLAAAYVLQQHNDTVRARNPRLDSNWIAREVATTQSMVRDRLLSTETAALVVADRLRTIANAAGVSICVVRNGWLFTLAESGMRGVDAISSRSQIATERLKNGREFHSSDAQKDERVDTAQCRRTRIGSLLAVPIREADETIGLIEVRWSEVDAFHECDVRTCESMAELVSKLVRREGEAYAIHLPSIEAVDEPAAVTFLPVEDEIVRMEEESGAGSGEGAPSPAAETPAAEIPAAEISSAETNAPLETRPEAGSDGTRPESASFCRVCGREFGPDEVFCGNCSLPRVAAGGADGLQSKWASMWFMQQAQENNNQPKSMSETRPSFAGPSAAATLDSAPADELNDAGVVADHASSEAPAEPPRTFGPLRVRTPPAYPSYPPRYTQTPSELEQETDFGENDDDKSPGGARKIGRYVFSHGITGVLVAGALGLAIVIGTWLARPSSQHLTLFESMLVQLGMAEVP